MKINEDCIFCKIVNAEIPCFKIYEDKDYLAFLDISQFTKGHTLVIPKKHAEFVWDVVDANYFPIVRKIARHYKKLGYKYVDMMSFGRAVAHAHIHLVPHNHDKDSADYDKSLAKLDDFMNDASRRPSIEEGNLLAGKLKL